MSNSTRPSVSVHCRYFKKPNADAVLDHSHSKRNGFTSSQNVYSEFSKFNKGFYFHGASSCTEALEVMMLRHKQVTGKKIRCDSNVLFEHVVSLSESQYSKLERKYTAKRVLEAFIEKLKMYALAIKKAFHFEPLGFDIHLDEGRFENEMPSIGDCASSDKKNTQSEIETKKGSFIRNIHAHVQFINFSFSSKKMYAPLRHLYKKGKDGNGKTNRLNPNFEKIQDIAFSIFKNWGFKRGQTRNIYNRKHLEKEAFVKRKLTQAIRQTNHIQTQNKELSVGIDEKQSEIKRLEETILNLKIRAQWVKSQVIDLKILKREVSQAIITESEIALKDIVNKVSRTEDNLGQSLQRRRK